MSKQPTLEPWESPCAKALRHRPPGQPPEAILRAVEAAVAVVAIADEMDGVRSTTWRLNSALRAFHNAIRNAGGRAPDSAALTTVMAAHIERLRATVPGGGAR